MILKIKNKSNNELPTYASSRSSGFDLRANVSGDIIISPGSRAIISTGLYFEIPEEYEIQVRSRSGLAAKKGVFVLNSPGTIDEDYKDEVCVILFNLGNEDFVIHPGDRIAQGVLCKIDRPEIIEVDEISKENDRGGGFGHTGVN